jgi:4,5-DOPA dioxygenase extradiol
MEHPQTIHDFGGFPAPLYEVQYPAPGDASLAHEVRSLVKSTEIRFDDEWGLDHGCWSVMRHMYPEADVPIVQLSVDLHKTPKEHYELGKELAPLRKRGILIVGSGNIVHNLGLVAWDKISAEYGYEWALEAKAQINACIENGDHERLLRYASHGGVWDLAIPTPEHFLPLLYVLALQEDHERVRIFNDKAVAGSLTMTSMMIE